MSDTKVTIPKRIDLPGIIWKELAPRMNSTCTIASRAHRLQLVIAHDDAMTNPKIMKMKMAVPVPTCEAVLVDVTIESYSATVKSRTMRNTPKSIATKDCSEAKIAA